MQIHFTRLCAAALAGAFFLAGVAAHAQQAQPAAPQQQQQQPQGPIKADLVAVQPDWTKVCGSDPQTKKEMCYTTRDFGEKADQPLLALAVYDPKGADQKVIRLLLPPGLMLKPGFRFAVDKGQMESGSFEICFPNGCFAESKVKTAVVDSLKKGEKLMGKVLDNDFYGTVEARVRGRMDLVREYDKRTREYWANLIEVVAKDTRKKLTHRFEQPSQQDERDVRISLFVPPDFPEYARREGLVIPAGMHLVIMAYSNKVQGTGQNVPWRNPATGEVEQRPDYGVVDYA
ncbi:MAG: invasion associated locus B family protein, partial [Methylocystis sp.]|nr:invasion associated locus B family protein [Methylocystis sp.]